MAHDMARDMAHDMAHDIYTPWLLTVFVALLVLTVSWGKTFSQTAHLFACLTNWLTDMQSWLLHQEFIFCLSCKANVNV